MSKSIKFHAEETDRGFFWPFVYFHGLLELQMGCDLVRSGVDLADVQDGLHDCVALTDMGPAQVKLALWSYDNGHGGTNRKGIIVRADEAKDMEYLNKHYDAKSHCL